MLDQDLVGSIIDGRYKILALIGQGGAGTVYKAQEIGFERELAVKIMHLCHLSDAESRLRFEREGKVLAALRQRNIVTIYRLGLWNNQIPYLAMEYLEGKSLKQILDETTKLEPFRCLHIATQLCAALEYVHANGVVHRDIKPGNILILDNSEIDFVKIVDFGLMKLMPESWQASQKLTQTGLLIGTTQYLSPEQCLGQNIDKRADIYSLACVIYECLAGFPPLEADNPIGLIHKHAHEMPKALSDILPKEDLPEGLDYVLRKAMQKNPELRYQSMSEFQEALKLVEAKQGKSIEANNTLRDWGQIPEKNFKWKVLASLAILLITLLGFAIYQFNNRRNLDSVPKAKVLNSTINSQLLTEAQELIPQAEQYIKQGKITWATAVASKVITKLVSITADIETAIERTKEQEILIRIRKLVQACPNPAPTLRIDQLDKLYTKYATAARTKEQVLLRQIQLELAEHQNNLHETLNCNAQLFSLHRAIHDPLSEKKYLQKNEKLIKAHLLQGSTEEALLFLHKAEFLIDTDIKQPLQIRNYLDKSYNLQQQFLNDYSFLLVQIYDACMQIKYYSLAEKALLARHKLYQSFSPDLSQLINTDYQLAELYQLLGRNLEAKKYCLEEIVLLKQSKAPTAQLIQAEAKLKTIEKAISSSL